MQRIEKQIMIHKEIIRATKKTSNILKFKVYQAKETDVGANRRRDCHIMKRN